MNISVMNSKDNWNIFSKNRNAIYGVAIISIMIFHFFEDIANSNLSGGGLGFLGKLYNTFIGSVGVEFFVFLSGVGLYFSMSKDSNILHFFQKRIKRILPAYLMVAIPYWIVIDLIIMQKGVKMFAFDFGFVTFFTQGTRTFWYVLFIVFAYLIYPFVYKILHVKWSDWGATVNSSYYSFSYSIFTENCSSCIEFKYRNSIGKISCFFHRVLVWKKSLPECLY